MMKKITTALIMLLFTVSLTAQEWQTDLQIAKDLAKEQNKEILLVFQGSDWCAPCIKLEREIWTTDTFKEYSKNHYILVKADFPRRKKNQLETELQEKNNKLAEKYNPQGYFPLVVVMDKEGHVLGKTGYKKVTPKEYIEILNSFKS
jgi:thioredoxin-related protein